MIVCHQEHTEIQIFKRRFKCSPLHDNRQHSPLATYDKARTKTQVLKTGKLQGTCTIKGRILWVLLALVKVYKDKACVTTWREPQASVSASHQL